MTAQEKFDSCRYKPDEKVEIFEGCPCQKKKKLVSQCIIRSIIDVKPENCADCDLFEAK